MSCIIKTGHKEKLLKVHIEGNATWENAKFFLDFIKKYIEEGKNEVLIDLSCCSFLDSTYFGVLAEIAEIFETKQQGGFYLANMSKRLLKEIKTIGLNKLVSFADEKTIKKYEGIQTTQSSFDEDYTKLQKAKQILKAHETLEKLSFHNKEEFKDVIKYFKNYIKDYPENE